MSRWLNVRNLAGLVGGLGVTALLLMFYVGPVGLPTWTYGVAVGLAALGGAFALADYVQERRHSEEFRNFAELHGWTYTSSTRAYNGRFSTFPFATGRNRHQENILTGQLNGVDCATFTHHFEVETGRDRKADQAYQVTMVEIPVRLPRLDLVPEKLGARIAKAVGGMDVDFESYEFNRRWRVKCNDLKYAHDLLDPRMIERLTWADATEMAVRIDGAAVMVWQAGRHGTADLARRMGVLTAIARRIPDHVVRHYRELGYGADGTEAAERPLVGPDWATKGGVLNSGKYTGIVPGPQATGEGYRRLPGSSGSAPGVLGWLGDWSGDWDA